MKDEKYNHLHLIKDWKPDFFMHVSYHGDTVDMSIREARILFGHPEPTEADIALGNMEEFNKANGLAPMTARERRKERNSCKNKYLNYHMYFISDEEGYRAITLYDMRIDKRPKLDDVIQLHIGSNGRRESGLAKHIIEYNLAKLRSGDLVRTKFGGMCPFGLKGRLNEKCLECEHCDVIDTDNKTIVCIK
jgi:hypothetical protein